MLSRVTGPCDALNQTRIPHGVWHRRYPSCTTADFGGPAYQIVGRVEWKTLRGLRDNTLENVADSSPVNGAVVDSAPMDLELWTISYDDAIVDLSGEGPLVLSAATRERLRSGYEDPYGVVVLTLYNRDPHNKIPKGNSYDYHINLEQFNRVDPGDRVPTTVDRDGRVAVKELLTVDRAGER